MGCASRAAPPKSSLPGLRTPPTAPDARPFLGRLPYVPGSFLSWWSFLKILFVGLPGHQFFNDSRSKGVRQRHDLSGGADRYLIFRIGCQADNGVDHFL